MERIKKAIDTGLELAQNGETTHLETFLKLKDLEKYVKAAMDTIVVEATTEAEAYGKGKHNVGNYFFSTRTTGSGWNFKDCATWVEQKDKLTAVEKKLKRAHAAFESDMLTVDQATGEIPNLPEYRAGKISVIFEGKIE